MNGTSTDFWGLIDYRNEFIELMQATINRFSFKLENHFLVFEVADHSMVYLVGFPDDVFLHAKKMRDGRVGLIPHLKVLFKLPSGDYKEVNKKSMNNTTEYYKTLRTAVVPFFASISQILGKELSQGMKDTFDMWL